MARRRVYSLFWNDRYKPPEFHEGDRVAFRGGRVPRRDSGGTVLVWKVLEVGVTRRNDWRGWIRVRSSRSGRVRHALPVQLRMVESAAEQVAKAVMEGGP